MKARPSSVLPRAYRRYNIGWVQRRTLGTATDGSVEYVALVPKHGQPVEYPGYVVPPSGEGWAEECQDCEHSTCMTGLPGGRRSGLRELVLMLAGLTIGSAIVVAVWLATEAYRLIRWVPEWVWLSVIAGYVMLRLTGGA